MLWGILSKKDLKAKTFLITAGPTAEDIDPVRFLTNRSTGKMGIAVAEAANKRGADVILVLGPVAASISGNIKLVRVRSAEDMYKAVINAFSNCDYYISTAAIADYTPLKMADNKIKKQKANFFLELKRTKDIIEELGKIKSEQQKVVGFSVETTNLVENSLQKLKNKNLDMIIANNPKQSGAGFAVQTNQVEIITKDYQKSLPLMSKDKLAHIILDKILQLEHK